MLEYLGSWHKFLFPYHEIAQPPCWYDYRRWQESKKYEGDIKITQVSMSIC
jgi:hypothetical protein